MADQKKTTLQKDLTRKIAFFVIIMMALILGTVAVMMTNALKRELQNAMVDEASHVEDVMENFLAFQKENIEGLAKNDFITNSLIDISGREKYLPTLMDDFIKARKIAAITVVDFEGKIIRSSMASPPDYLLQTDLLSTLEAGHAHLEMAPDRKRIIFIEPILFYQTPQGAVIMEIDLGTLGSQVISSVEDHSYRILRQDKVVFEKQARRGDLLTVSHDFSPSSKYLHQLGLRLEVGTLKTSYLGLVKNIVIRLSLLALTFVILSVLLAIKVAGGLAKPVAALCERVRHTDIFTPVEHGPLNTINELEELATEFDRRNQRLQEEIAERKQAEQSIIKASLEWSAAMDASDDALYLLDINRHILHANKVFYQMTASSPQIAIGQHIEKIIHPKGEEVPCPVCRAQQELRDEVIILEHDHPDNPSGIPIEITVKVVRNETGKPISIFMKLHDLTEHQKAEEERIALESQLRQAQKMEAVGTLAGGIAHDLNNILTPIVGFTEMARNELPENSEKKKYLDEVLKASNRATDLVHQILTFSRRTEQERKPLKIQFIIKEAIKLLRSSIPTTVEIKGNIDETCGAVLADPTQVHQIIMNLGTNAFHAMSEQGGILAISLQEIDILPEDCVADLNLAPGTYVKLEVSDTGHGIPSEIVEKIFDPYFTTKKQGKGTGLGLSIVHGIVKNYNGKITVYSECGVGTTFHVYLPCLRGETDAVEIKQMKRLPTGNERILVVDDEESILNMEKLMLTTLGYQVDTAPTGNDALLLMQSQPDHYDILVTDMTMPGMNGVELAQKVWAIRKDTPVIICTGFSETLNGTKAKALGVSKYLTKPLSQITLAEAVREALDQKGPSKQ